MAKKLFSVGIVMGVVLLLFVLFPDVLMPQVDTLPEAPSAMAEFIKFDLPRGFTANVFASDLPGIRVMQRDLNGTVVASLMKEGKVVGVVDKDADGEADQTTILIDGLSNPHGLALLCGSDRNDTCSLYVAQSEEVDLYSYDPTALSATFVKRVVDLPSAGSRVTRALLIDASHGELFVSIGSSCEFCQELDRRYATIQTLDLETEKMSTYSKGLHSTVFMALQPTTGYLWGTEASPVGPNSDQHLPDEINLLKKGRDYGWPFCYGNNIPVEDLELEDGSVVDRCNKSKTPSVIDLPPHSGPLGLAFIPSEGWPLEYANDLLVVYNGSGGSPDGDEYRIVRVEMGPDGLPSGSIKPFMSGFETDSGELLGRPVDLLPLSDGTLLVSGDLFGRIYRVSWKGTR